VKKKTPPLILIKIKHKIIEKLQENDVLKRIKEKTTASKNPKKPVSISIHAYKKSDKNHTDLMESGLSELFTHLINIINEAKIYKVGKAKSQMINFLDKEMLVPLSIDVKPNIDKLIKNANSSIISLNKKRDSLTSMITADVLYEVPHIINRHKTTNNKNAISSEINQLIENKINTALQQELTDFVSNIKKTSSSLSPDALGNFKDITVDIKQIKGSGAESATRGIGAIGGAAGGAALGTVVPVIGTVIGAVAGGLLGGLFGSSAGKRHITTEIVKEKVDVSSEDMIEQTSKSIKEKLPPMIEAVFQDAISSIESVKTFGTDISKTIDEFSDNLQKTKNSKL
jgi:hypothetical protein